MFLGSEEPLIIIAGLVQGVSDIKNGTRETFLLVQWVRLHASTTESVDSTPDWGTKIAHASSAAERRAITKSSSYPNKMKQSSWSGWQMPCKEILRGSVVPTLFPPILFTLGLSLSLDGIFLGWRNF